MSKAIEAVPTRFNGTTYKSRLEARFAEWLSDRGVIWSYETPLPESDQGYIPDFYLPDFSDNGILIEVKPEQFIAELNIFSNDLDKSLIPWICVDQMSRSEWRILKANLAFWGGMDFHFPFPCKIDIHRVDVSEDGCFLELKFFPAYVTVTGCL